MLSPASHWAAMPGPDTPATSPWRREKGPGGGSCHHGFQDTPKSFPFYIKQDPDRSRTRGQVPAASGAALACWQRVKVLGAPAHAGGRDVCEALTGVKSTGHVLGVGWWPGRAAEPVLLPRKWGWGGDGDTQIAGALRAASQAWRRPLARPCCG